MSENIYESYDIEEINKSFTPADNLPIYRYMDFSKYVDLLTNTNLFFCNSKNFEDKFEGEMPESFYNGWNKHKERYKELLKTFDNLFPAYINCWNTDEKEDESYALWKVYTKQDTGICIKTTVGNLKKALNNDAIKIYKVKYLKSFSDDDYDLELPMYFKEELSVNRPIMEVCKLNAYKYENEIRAIYIENSKDKGKNFPVNLPDLIKEIYFSPYCSEWFIALVKKITNEKSNLKDTVMFHNSDILLHK